MRKVKVRKPRGIKKNGHPSYNLCEGCYAFECDPSSMSIKWNNMVRNRLERGVCVACGKNPCKCKSKLHIDQPLWR